MNKAQNQVIAAHRDAIAAEIIEAPNDQPDVRWSATHEDDGALRVRFESRVVNPDQGYESDWYWADEICIGPRGRLIG